MGEGFQPFQSHGLVWPSPENELSLTSASEGTNQALRGGAGQEEVGRQECECASVSVSVCVWGG